MRRAVTAVAAACCSPARRSLAFFSGGYFPQPRLIAAIVVWALVLGARARRPGAAAARPRRAGSRSAGWPLLTAWSALSITWAPLGGPAIASVQRLVLYTGALLRRASARCATRARCARSSRRSPPARRS